MAGAKYVTLETNVHRTLKDAQGTTCGAPNKSLKKNGPGDSGVLWGNGSPPADVEVKNNVWSYAQIREDIKRVGSVVLQNKENSSFQFGLIAFYSSCIDNTRTKARQQLKRRTSTLLARSQEHVPTGIAVHIARGTIHVVQDSAWVATCLVLK